MKETQQLLFAEIISITGGLFAGIMLARVTGVLERVPGILILLPAFLELRGNIGGTLAARLGTALHLGIMKGKKSRKILKSNVIATFFLTIIISIPMGIFSWLVSPIINIEVNLLEIIIISLIASIIANAITIALTIIITFWLFKKNYDPDDIMGPVVSTIGDIVSVFSLVIAALVVINV